MDDELFDFSDEPASEEEKGVAEFLNNDSGGSTSAGKSRNPKVLGFAAAVALLVVCIALMFAKGIFVPKKAATVENTPAPTVATQPGTVVVYSEPANPVTKSPVSTSKPVPAPVSSGLTEVSDPRPEGSFNAIGVVLKKHVFTMDKQLFYAFDMRVTNGKNSVNTKYFATKSAYDGVNVGDSFNVVYTADSKGNFVILSISK